MDTTAVMSTRGRESSGAQQGPTHPLRLTSGLIVVRACIPWRRMKRSETVSKIMTAEVETVHTAQKLSEVRRLLAGNAYHHVPVVSGKELVGIISATDMLKLSLAAYGVDQRAIDAMLDSQHTIESVMTKTPTTLKVKDTIRTAAEMLGEGKFHSLPVVDEGNLVGLVTSTDLIRYLLAQY